MSLRSIGVTLAVVLAVALGAPEAAAQTRPARSTDYLFAATADDVRALWVNPAGLAAVPEASIMADFVIDRPVMGSVLLGQWGAGFNSRGFAFAYQRNRFPGRPSNDAFRFGTGFRFRRGALGTSYTLYRSDSTETGFDLGVRYELARQLAAAAVLRHVGRPVVSDEKLPLVGILGLAWQPLRQVLDVAGEVHFTERLLRSGWDVTYRAGANFSTTGDVPVGGLAAIALGSNLAIDRFSLGVVLGAADRGIFLGSVTRSGGTARFEQMSVTGVASRRFPGIRP